MQGWGRASSERLCSLRLNCHCAVASPTLNDFLLREQLGPRRLHIKECGRERQRKAAWRADKGVGWGSGAGSGAWHHLIGCVNCPRLVLILITDWFWCGNSLHYLKINELNTCCTWYLPICYFEKSVPCPHRACITGVTTIYAGIQYTQYCVKAGILYKIR